MGTRNLTCENACCFNWDSKRFFCSCRICDRKGSASFLNQCRANKKFKKIQNEYDCEVTKLVDSMVEQFEREEDE